VAHAKNRVGRGNQSSILNLPKDRIFHVGYPLQLRVGFEEAMQKLAAREISRSNAESRALFQAVAYSLNPSKVVQHKIDGKRAWLTKRACPDEKLRNVAMLEVEFM